MKTKNLSSPLYQLVQNSASITVQLSGNICSSVPFSLGLSPKNNQGPKKSIFPRPSPVDFLYGRYILQLAQSFTMKCANGLSGGLGE